MDARTVASAPVKVVRALLWPQAGQKKAAPSEAYRQPQTSQADRCVRPGAASAGATMAARQAGRSGSSR